MAAIKSTIWIFGIEPIATRYTCEWHTHVLDLLDDNLQDKYNIVQVDGVQNNTVPTPGAFLNFSDTNYWKSSQFCNWLNAYNDGEVSSDDQFLFTDAWNPIVLQLRYMNDLLGNNWKIHGLWHAGAYDPYDALGQRIGNADWVMHTEKAMYYSYDHNYFATDFHIWLFLDTHSDTEDHEWGTTQIESKKIIKTGWPMEYMESILEPYKNLPKRNLILFPHRIAPEKQVEIFRDLAITLPQYEFIVCQDKQLSKPEYHKLLGEAKMIFSASNQETLGISPIEGAVTGCIPLMPKRLSYEEMYNSECLYPSEWSDSYRAYLTHKDQLVAKIVHIMENYDTYKDIVSNTLVPNVLEEYFSATNLIKQLSKE